MIVDVSPVLVGRSAELDQLQAGLARTRAGETTVVLLSGEAGVGKTRLLNAVFDAADGVRVLTGGCIELGGEGLPFVPLVEALRTLARTADAADLERWLGPARSELSRLLPELAHAGAHGEQASASTAQLFELVFGVLARLADEQPLALVFEDLHWADRSTLDLVAFLLRALQNLRVLLVLTYRSDEVDRRSALRPLLATCERLRGVQRVKLRPFGRAEVAEQMAEILGREPDGALVDSVYDRSEGNAFFVEELLYSVRDGTTATELAPSLRDILLSRADRLSVPAQRLLRTAAVAGRRVPERLLAEVAAVPANELHAALREVVDASLLVVDEAGRGYTFRHALTRDAIYQELLPGERVELHLLYADALDRSPELAGDDASVAATLALHWYAAHDLPRALSASVRAGREAMTGFAAAEARRHFERALEIWGRVPDAEQRADADQPEVLRLTAAAANDVGDAERALALLDRAAELLGPDADPQRAAMLVELRAAVLRGLGEHAASLDALEKALVQLPVDPPTHARAAVLNALANTLLRQGDVERTPGITQAALAAARAVGSRALEADALVTSGSMTAYRASAERGEDVIREGLEVALAAGEHAIALRGYANLSDVLENRGDHRAAATVARDGIALASQVGMTRSVGAYLTGNLVEPLIRLGEWAEAERLASRTLTAGLIGVFAASLHELLGYLAVHTGRPRAASEHADECRRQLGGTLEPQFVQALAYIDAEVARVRGSLDASAALVAAALHTGDGGFARYSWPLAWLAARIDADALTLARDRQDTHRPAKGDHQTVDLAALDAMAGPSSPATLAYRATVLAEQARARTATDPTVDATSAWRDAADAWRVADEAWPLAYALFRLAEARCTSGNRADAGAPLREAAKLAERLGAAPLSADIAALARRSRVSLDPAAPASPTNVDAPFALTDREREVLRLVATGLTNGQIAKALFISPKTASVHVSNILAKLGVNSRTEAAGVAHRLGLLDEA